MRVIPSATGRPAGLRRGTRRSRISCSLYPLPCCVWLLHFPALYPPSRRLPLLSFCLCCPPAETPHRGKILPAVYRGSPRPCLCLPPARLHGNCRVQL